MYKEFISFPSLKAKNDKIEAVLFWAHREKAGFFGKDRNAGKNTKQREMRKTKYKMD